MYKVLFLTSSPSNYLMFRRADRKMFKAITVKCPLVV